jgi:hypothetical protein
MIEKIDETALPDHAQYLGTDWQNNLFDPVLSQLINELAENGRTVVCVKTDHYNSDHCFEQWSKDYYCI